MKSKAVGKTLGDVEAEALVDTFSDTLSKVVAKRIADTLTGVEAEAAVKTKGDTVAGVKVPVKKEADTLVGEMIAKCERRISTLNVGRQAGKGRGQNGYQDTERRGLRATVRHSS